MKKVLILSYRDDEHLPLIVDRLGGRALLIASDEPLRMKWDSRVRSGWIETNDGPLGFEEVGAVWNRRAYSIPGPEEWFQQFAREETRACVVSSLSDAIPARRWVNHPAAVMGARDKLLQLRLAKELGLAVPDWIVSNDPDTILEFVADHGGVVVVKPLAASLAAGRNLPGLIFARPVGVSGLRRLLSQGPILPMFLQERVDKSADVRVAVVDDAVSAVRMVGTPTELLDFRRSYDLLRYEHLDLPVAVGTGLLAMLRRLGLRYGAFDLAESASGLVLLELNAAGQFGWTEKRHGGPADFSGCLANALLSSCDD